ncbi:MAG: hypothetical protein GXY33_21510 [Phycisphaerae bacterium]|nr:hypothetical protein [Phycisphaerae bacterium]
MASLTERQLKAIPFIVAAPTYTEGLRQARVSRKTFYAWMKIPEFRQALAEQRRQVAEAALDILEQNITRAVEALAGLLETEDEKLKRAVCNDLIAHFFEYQRGRELESRLAAIEEALARRDRG